MKKNILIFSILLPNFLNAQMANNAFNLNNNYGDLKMRRYVSGDMTWKRALVSGNSTTLIVNYSGDYQGGTHIQGTKLTINGNVGIGTTNPDSKLSVNGNIHTKEVKVDLNGWPDYVFAKDYDLPSLHEVEKHINEKGHLSNIPSAKEVEENGIQLGKMNKKLLQKIEELILYTIAQEKKLKKQEQKNLDLETRLAKLEKLLEVKK